MTWPQVDTVRDGTTGATSDLEQTSASRPKKSYRQILREEIAEGREAMDRPALAVFLSGLSAGLDIGFSVLLMALVQTMFAGAISPSALHVATANMYAIGFIFVVLGRSELFTEQTTLAMLPVLSRQRPVRELVKLWVVVYLANQIGGLAFAGLARCAGPLLGIIELRAFEEIARNVVNHPAHGILLSAILAGWLMGLLSWLVTAARDTISQIAIVWLITTTIGMLHLHHSVVGSVEVLAGLFSGDAITVLDWGRFLLWTTLGNIIGGVVFVALLKYSQVTPEPGVDLTDESGPKAE